MYSTLLPLVFALPRFKTFNKPLKVLIIYLLVSFSTDNFHGVCMKMIEGRTGRMIATKQIYFAFTVVEYIILAYMYKLELNTVKTKNFFWLSLVLFFVAAFFEWYSNSIITFSSALSAAFIISFSIAVFYQIFKEQEIPLLGDYYFFWINAGLLIYFGAYFFLSFFEIYIRTIHVFGQFLVAIHSFVAVTFHLLVTIGICKIKKS